MPTKKILIADDDPALVRLLGLNLQKAGYEVIVAVDGCQAVELAHRHRPDLYILDVNMPAGGGISVQERIQKSMALSMAPTIYLTGDKRPIVQATAKRMGAFSVLYKPIEAGELLQLVRRAIEEGIKLPEAAATLA